MTTNTELNAAEIAMAEDATSAHYPVLQEAYNQGRDHMISLFPEFASALVTGYKVIPIRTPEYGRYIAKISPSRKVIFIGAWMESCPVVWDGKELVLRANRRKTAEESWAGLIGLIRHELAHAIQHATNIDDGHGSTHLCRSWWWVMSEWANRLYGENSFLSVDDFERILKLIRKKKDGKHVYEKDFRDSFTNLCKHFEYNNSQQDLLNIRADWLDENTFPLTEAHGNKGKKRSRIEKTCSHCGIAFMGSQLQVRCSIACNVKAGRLANRLAKLK